MIFQDHTLLADKSVFDNVALPLMSAGMFLFGLAVILSNWATTYFFMMGGTLSGIPDTVRMIFGRKR